MPGVTVNIVDVPVARGVASDTGKWLVIGDAERGSTTSYEHVTNMREFGEQLGARVTYSSLYDAAETFFRLGGRHLYVARRVGPAAVSATVTLDDATSDPALTVTANSEGAWGNNLTVQVLAGSVGGTFVLKIAYEGEVVELSPDLADAAAAIDWAEANSSYIVVEDPGATADPAVVAATPLAAGADDRASISSTQTNAALARFDTSLGFAQVSAPGIYSTTVQQSVLNHCADLTRIPILDSDPTDDFDEAGAAITALTGEGRKRGVIVGPWGVIPGITQDTTRQVPYSAVQAANWARSDGAGLIPLVALPVAGDNGFAMEGTFTSGFVRDLAFHWNEDEINELNGEGFAPARISPANGYPQQYGNRTMANINTQRAWLEASSARLFAYVYWRGREIAEAYVHKPLDPRLITVNRFGAELQTFLQDLYDTDQLFNDPAQAVNVGPQVNTVVTRQARELHADIAVQPVEGAEDVIINIGAEAA